MKAIILAAGQGTRLRPYTNDRPKCLVELRGKPLLDCQLDVLRAAGINDLNIICGYLADRVDRPGLTKHLNPHYAETNMVSTLFCARSIMTGDSDIIIAYGDIVYETRLLAALTHCDAPVCLVVDAAWRRYWAARMDDPLSDAETLRLTESGYVTELGRKPQSYDDIQGQYTGLIKIRADHVTQLIETWEAMDRSALYDGKDYDNMFMTSFLQHLIDTCWPVKAVLVENGWLEVDSPEDLAIDADQFVSADLFHPR